jgi:two-component system cell cycle response regulator DivK
MPKVLYIEDDPALADLVQRRLRRRGYEVILANNGPSGLERAATERPDLILLDIDLGKFSPDGFEVNRSLKADPVTLPIPVIVMTAHADWSQHRELATREGIVDHIVKPISWELLLQTIAAHTEPQETPR